MYFVLDCDVDGVLTMSQPLFKAQLCYLRFPKVLNENATFLCHEYGTDATEYG